MLRYFEADLMSFGGISQGGGTARDLHCLSSLYLLALEVKGQTVPNSVNAGKMAESPYPVWATEDPQNSFLNSRILL